MQKLFGRPRPLAEFLRVAIFGRALRGAIFGFAIGLYFSPVVVVLRHPAGAAVHSVLDSDAVLVMAVLTLAGALIGIADEVVASKRSGKK